MTKRKVMPAKAKPGPVTQRKALRDNPLERRERHPVVELLTPQLATPSTSSLQKPDVASSLATVEPNVASSLATLQTSELATHSKNRQATRPNQNLAYKARNLVTVAIRFDAELNKKINNFCRTHNIEKQQFFREVASYTLDLPNDQLATVFRESEFQLARADKMIIYKTHDDIIYRYREFTGRSWTAKDDRLGMRYNKVNPLLLDIAFVLTIERKLRGNTAREPIRSFNYFTTEIEVLLAQEKAKELPGGLPEYHRFVMNTWHQRIKKEAVEKWKLGEKSDKGEPH
ncbi:MAG: hypothetical protein K1Y36_24070 [Blastocatellia bacterium]|nr:hypothetical protein [Blastocatellia bacterium]